MSSHEDLVRIEGVTKRFGAIVAVDDVTLQVRENEFFALLGPSGCGKTTLLRVLAGFETPDEGCVLLDGRDLVDVKPYRRPLNMMFQSYALFPHMSVADNVAYGLKMERRPKAEIEERVDEALAMVKLTGLARRRPNSLSGGQRQRVALARALVKRPRLLVLDEPLSALDRQTRGEMQIELKRLQHTIGITFLVVTHDQEEALGLADRIAVMRDGRVLQVGTPTELYERPVSHWVASFLGDSNVFRGRVGRENGRPVLESDVATWRAPPSAGDDALVPGAPAAVLVRPERLAVVPLDGDGRDARNAVEGVVAEVVYAGAWVKVVIDGPGGETLVAHVPARSGDVRTRPGERVRLAWAPEDGVLVRDDERQPNDEPKEE